VPRVSRAVTEKNREAIERASSRLFREQGLGVSLSDVMGAVGLTHGGFYGHFRSKDELVGTACASAFADSVTRWRRRIDEAGDRRTAHAALIEKYLTPESRASAGTSCPLSALAADVARESEDKPVRRTFHDGLERLVELLAGVQPVRGRRARERALVELSTLVGAMALARATGGRPLSDDFMSAARHALLEVPPPRAGKVRRARPTTEHARRIRARAEKPLRTAKAPSTERAPRRESAR
jgi:TetR/AcrR family transcriptional regulator, transcriptional repressor for nem operon